MLDRHIDYNNVNSHRDTTIPNHIQCVAVIPFDKMNPHRVANLRRTNTQYCLILTRACHPGADPSPFPHAHGPEEPVQTEPGRAGVRQLGSEREELLAGWSVVGCVVHDRWVLAFACESMLLQCCTVLQINVVTMLHSSVNQCCYNIVCKSMLLRCLTVLQINVVTVYV